jgi:hypothetical protein
MPNRMGPISLGHRAKGASASSRWRHPAGFAANGACPDLIKERLSGKASDEQRVDNCKVPVELRGPKPRPDDRRDDARSDQLIPRPSEKRRLDVGADGRASSSSPRHWPHEAWCAQAVGRGPWLAALEDQAVGARATGGPGDQAPLHLPLESDARVELARRPARTPAMRWARSNYVSSANARPAGRRSCCHSRHRPASLQPCVRVIGRVVR